MRRFALVKTKDYSTEEDLNLYDKHPMPLYSLFSTKASKALYALVTWSQPAVVATIRDALNTPPSTRSQVMQSTIMNMLLRTRGISQHLTMCSQQQLEQVSTACQFIHLAEPGTILANEGENVDCCFIVITGSVKVVKWKSKQYRKRQANGLEDKIKYKRHPTAKVITKGIFIGEDVFRGKHCWRTDVITVSPDTSICLLPIQYIVKLIGMVNSKSQNFMKCFWKHCQIWNYSKIKHEKTTVHHFDDGLSDKLEHINSSSYFFRDQHSNSHHHEPPGYNGVASCGTVVSQTDLTQQDPSTNVATQEDMQNWLTQRAYLRCYRPGDVIFEQGSESHLLYVVMLGECAHIRELKYLSSVSKSKKVGETEEEKEQARAATSSVKVSSRRLRMVCGNRSSVYTVSAIAFNVIINSYQSNMIDTSTSHPQSLHITAYHCATTAVISPPPSISASRSTWV